MNVHEQYKHLKFSKLVEIIALPSSTSDYKKHR